MCIYYTCIINQNVKVTMTFKRTAENELSTWYQAKNRKPLIIRGARQTGKSTLVRTFAKTMNLELFEVNLERHINLDDVFRTMQIEPVLREVSALCNRPFEKAERPLLFLDEIQATPQGLKWLRYIYEDRPEIAVIAAGSLLEFALKEDEISVPVGRVDYLWLRPMSFKEYLLACGEEYLCNKLSEITLKDISAWPQKLHENLLNHQREYFVLGGMPSVIRSYLNDGSSSAKNEQEAILTSYLDDLAKYARRQPLSRLQRIFRAVPGVLGQKVKFVNLSRDDQNREVKAVLELFAMAGIILTVNHSDCSGIPLAASENSAVFKLLFIDIGLTSRSLGLDWNEYFRMDDTRLINEGSLAEQFVGQELIVSNTSREAPRLNYWHREKAQSNAELDYVISMGRHIIPIEVKAGSTGSLRSLHQFVAAKGIRYAIRFDAGPPSSIELRHRVITPDGTKEIKYHLLSLPSYLACEARRLTAASLK